MSDDLTPEEVERQIADFVAEIDDAIVLDDDAFRADAAALIITLIVAPDGRDVMHAVREFAGRANSPAYAKLVYDQVITIWALWVLHEGVPALTAQYSRHLHAFVLAVHSTGMPRPTITADSDSSALDDDVAGEE